MITIDVAEFSVAVERLILAVAGTARDGSGLKIHARINPDHFSEMILDAIGKMNNGSEVCLRGRNGEIIRRVGPPPDPMSADLTDFMRMANK